MVRMLRQAVLLGTLVVVVLPAILRADESDDQYAVAAGHYAQERWELALAEFTVFRKSYPAHRLASQAAFFRAEALVQLGRFLEARTALQAILARGPTSPFARQALFRSGESAYLSDQLGGAKIDLEQFVARYADDELCAYALDYLGVISLKQADAAGAEAIFARALKQFPASPRSGAYRLGRGRALFELKRYDEAANVFDSLASNAAMGLEARYWLGLTHRATQRWASAAKTLLAAAGAASSKDGLLPAIRFHAGDSLLMAGDRRGATEQFDLALNDAPEGRWADDCLAGKLHAASAGEDHEAVDRLAREFAGRFGESPLEAEVLLLHASALMALGKFVEAVAPLQAALASPIGASGRPVCQARLAICYARLGRIDEAKATYETFIREHAGHDLVLPTTERLAELAYGIGDQAWSSTLFTKLAVEGDRSTTVSGGLSGLAWSQLKADDFDRSADTFKRLLNDHPEDPRAAEAALVLGQILQRQGKYHPALAMYHRVIDKHDGSPQLPAALLAAARLHDRLQQDDRAVALYEQLVQNHPKFEQVDAAIYGWAWALRELDRDDDAAGRFMHLHAEFPTSTHWAEATYLLAQSAAGSHRYDRANELLAELLDAPGDRATVSSQIATRALYLQGHIAAERARWAEVAPPMQRLVADFPESSLYLAASFWIAEATFRDGKMEKAGELFDGLAGQARGHDQSWLGMITLRRAQVLAHQEKWAEALSIARQIATEYPDFDQGYEADYLVGRCLAARGQLDDARGAYQLVIRSTRGGKTETAAMAQWMIGETFMHQKDYPRARREYLRGEILYAYPQWQARSLLQAGKCHEIEGKWQEAIELYAELAKKYPNTTSTEEAERRTRVAQQRSVSVR